MGKGAGAVDGIGDVANKADDVADVAENAGKMDDVAEIAEKSGRKIITCGLQLGDGTISKNFLGKEISLNSDEQLIHESLEIIDDYCRLRLPDKFLDAYYPAYVLNQYEDSDI